MAAPTLSRSWRIERELRSFYRGGLATAFLDKEILFAQDGDGVVIADFWKGVVLAEGRFQEDEVTSAAVFDGGTQFVTASASGLLRVWSVTYERDNGDKLEAPQVKLERTLRGPKHVVRVIAARGTKVAVETKTTHLLQGSAPLVCLRFHPKQPWLVAGFETGALKVYTLEPPSQALLIGELIAHQSCVTAVDFAMPTNDEYGGLVSGSRNGRICVWPLGSLSPSESRNIAPIADFAIDGETVFAVQVLPTARTGCAHTFAPNCTSPWVILAATERGQIHVVNPVDGKRQFVIDTPHAPRGVLQLQLLQNADGDWLLMSAGEDCSLMWWRCNELHNAARKPYRVLLGEANEMVQVANLPNNAAHHLERSLAGNCDQTFLQLRSDNYLTLVHMFPTRTDFELLAGHTDLVIAADVSRDGCWIASGSKDSTVRLFSIRAKRCVAQTVGHDAPITAVAISRRHARKGVLCSCRRANDEQTLPSRFVAGGLFIISACTEGFVKLWEVDYNVVRDNIESGEVFHVRDCLASSLVHASGAIAIDLAPNNKLVAVCCNDKTVRICALPDLACTVVCKGHRRQVWCARFSPSEQVVATGSADHTIRIFSLQTGACLKTLTGGGAVTALDFLSLGTQIISATGAGQIELWNLKTCENVATFAHGDETVAEPAGGVKVWSISLDETRQRMVSCDAADRFIMWVDVTAAVENEERQKQLEDDAAAAEIEQLRRDGHVLEALTLTVRLGRPRHARTLLQSSLETSLFKAVEEVVGKAPAVASRSSTAQSILERQNSRNETATVDEETFRAWLQRLADPELKTLLEFATRWNTNSQTFAVANSLMALILESRSEESLFRVSGFATIARNFRCYVPRHRNRINGLFQRSFLLDLALYTEGALTVAETPDLPARPGVDSCNSLDDADMQQLQNTSSKEYPIISKRMKRVRKVAACAS